MNKKILAATLLSAAALASTPALAGDVAKGESVFKKCASCHMVGEGAQNKVGPILTNAVGAQIASVEGYNYGKSIAALGETGAKWTEEAMFEYLADPKDYLRTALDDKKAKSKMAFKLKSEEDRKDVIAYLASLSSNAGTAEEGATEENTEQEQTQTN